MHFLLFVFFTDILDSTAYMNTRILSYNNQTVHIIQSVYWNEKRESRGEQLKWLKNIFSVATPAD